MSNEEATLTRLLQHYEVMMQEWSIKNGEPGTMGIRGMNLGYTDEVDALRAAIELAQKHGAPKLEIVRVDSNQGGAPTLVVQRSS